MADNKPQGSQAQLLDSLLTRLWHEARDAAIADGTFNEWDWTISGMVDMILKYHPDPEEAAICLTTSPSPAACH